ncbi:hypothetical protein D3C87_1616880 [compost metagenome]
MVLVLMTIMPFFRIVRDNADGRMIKAGRLEFRDGGQGLGVVVEQTRNNRHKSSFENQLSLKGQRSGTAALTTPL